MSYYSFETILKCNLRTKMICEDGRFKCNPMLTAEVHIFSKQK